MLVLQFIVALIFACFCFFLHASKFCLINPGGVCLVHVNHLQLAILILLSWVIGYAVHGDLQATQRKRHIGMEESAITEACQTFFPPFSLL